MISVVDARGEVERRLTATIRREVEPVLPNLYRRSRRKAELALAGHGKPDAAHALPDARPFALDDLLAEEWWPSNRHVSIEG